MNVGISIFTSDGANIWNNGLNQHIAFLAQLFQRCRGVEGVFLLNAGSSDELPIGMRDVVGDVPLVKPEDVTHRVDVVIEMGAQLPMEWMRHIRALGARLILYLAGQPFVGAAEPPIFGRTGGLTLVGVPWHEVWLSPHHMHTSAAMMRTLTRLPVHEMPLVWSPDFLVRTIELAEAEGRKFGFCGEEKPKWRVGIYEPNISVVKNCAIAMLACEEAYRCDRDAVELMMVMNAMHMKEHPSFNSLAAGLDLTRDSRSSFEPRLGFADCMTRHSLNAVVSHQWECGLNYLYYDALYGGYPLIHNSEFLGKEGVGLYYPAFEASSAGRALIDARGHEAGFWDDYRAVSRRFLDTLAPNAPGNMQTFEQRLHA